MRLKIALLLTNFQIKLILFKNIIQFYLNLLQTIYQLNSYKKYQSNNILPKDAQLKFKIQYENFIHIISQTEFTIQTHSGILPQINLNAKTSYFVYQAIKIGVSAGNSDQSASKDNSQYYIQLEEIDRYPKNSISSQLNSSSLSSSFEMIYTTIPQYTLSPNSTYTFLVTATNINTNQTQQQNLTVDIPFSGFICQFNNGGIQSIRRDLNLKIECKDLDTLFDWNSDTDLSIQVVCKDLQLNSTCQNEQKQIINVNTNSTFQFIRRNSISAFKVQEWTVIVTKFQQSQKFAQIIVYLNDDFPILDLEFNKGYLMRKINNYEQLNFTFLIPFDQKQNLLDLSIAIIYNYEIIEILQPQYISHQFKIFNSIKELNFGDEINLKFAAQYTNNIINILIFIQKQSISCQAKIIQYYLQICLLNVRNYLSFVQITQPLLILQQQVVVTNQMILLININLCYF